MIVTKKTIENTDLLKKELDIIKEFSNEDFSKIDVIFNYKIVGRKKIEFCILGTKDILVADLTAKVVQKLRDFKWGTAQKFSKTLVRKWDKLYYFEDGKFKI
ncbi:hypothetical protein KM800_02890 [Clostridium tyrobutyricum]|uniref:hypothetical protein n=1 Tax=Clostridium tyrobutyricum TaxID=1519 RepID=UPI0010AB0034|nr:hypothetical protein [Clostridium tyrobutyricum]MBV4418280.1 hypothetical protein [Clostridium tyrobutyricum]QCH27625.1 hypothetical protein EZN00_01223 [Clostridium tyrobutyricum]